MCDPQLMRGGFNIGSGLRPKNSCLRANSCSSEAESSGKDFGSPRLASSEVNSRISVSARDSSNRNSISGFQLVEDVRRLKNELQQEMQLHSILENATGQKLAEISLPLGVPRHIQELLSSINALEACVSKLEQEMVSLQFRLSQERNERRLAEYRARHLSLLLSAPSPDDDIVPQGSSSLKPLDRSDSVRDSSGIDMSQELGDTGVERTSNSHEKLSNIEIFPDVGCNSDEMARIRESNAETCHSNSDAASDTRWVRPKDLWKHPNELSEEMVRCMKNIFISLSESSAAFKSSSVAESHSSPMSPYDRLSNLSSTYSEEPTVSSWTQSPQLNLQSSAEVLAADCSHDPYKARGKLSWVDIGRYALATEVSWMSVTKKQLEYAAEALRRFRLLVEHVAKVNPLNLGSNEKLAFWINIYNALIMHAYLAYGVPKSELKLFTLMQKAAYTVGGRSFSAAAIEYVVLRMKPPVYRPQIALLLALHKLRSSEEQRKFALDVCEPLVSFALSCGMHSSPAVRIYTANNVREELQEAHHDFIRASVGISRKGKLLVPKMLHCFAKNHVDDSKLAKWIPRYLPPHQAAFVDQCGSRRRKVLASWNCSILSYDSRFRYLFMPEDTPSA